MTGGGERIRVVLQQPCLTKYRVPIFRELARRPGIDLRVLYGSEEGITNVEPDGFRGEYLPLVDRHLGRVLLRYHPAQYRFCTRDEADVVVLSWSTRYLSLLPGLVRAHWNRLGVVLWGHGYSKEETPLRRVLRRRIARMGDSLLFYNYTAAQDFIDHGGQPDRVFVALNTIDLEPVRAAAARWRDDTPALARFRHEHGLGAGPVVLFVSRLFEANRVDLLIRAARPLADRFPGLRVVVVGDGPDGARLRALADEAGVREVVRFTGAVFGEMDLAPYFLAADVFCYPSNVGLSIIHALGYGVPIVTSDRLSAHNPEIEAFRDGINGLSFRGHDESSLIETLTTLLRDHALRERMRQAALDTAELEYLVPRMVDGMESAIRTAFVRRPSDPV